MSTEQFRKLSARDRALVAVAVLLDGNDAPAYLEADATKGPALKAAAQELAQLEHEMRMPFVGTQLRIALEELR
jgi:hypothetical protein